MSMRLLRRFTTWFMVLLLAGLPLVIFAPNVQAIQQLANRSVVIGSSIPGAQTTYTFRFDIIGGVSVGSIEFLYCDNTPLFEQPCTAPSGLDVTTASLTN